MNRHIQMVRLVGPAFDGTDESRRLQKIHDDIEEARCMALAWAIEAALYPSRPIPTTPPWMAKILGET